MKVRCIVLQEVFVCFFVLFLFKEQERKEKGLFVYSVYTAILILLPLLLVWFLSIFVSSVFKKCLSWQYAL